MWKKYQYWLKQNKIEILIRWNYYERRRKLEPSESLFRAIDVTEFRQVNIDVQDGRSWTVRKQKKKNVFSCKNSDKRICVLSLSPKCSRNIMLNCRNFIVSYILQHALLELSISNSATQNVCFVFLYV